MQQVTVWTKLKNSSKVSQTLDLPKITPITVFFLLDLRTSCGATEQLAPAGSKVDLNHSFFFFFLDLFGPQSAMMDEATKWGLLWASAALKCMGRGLERWDENGADGEMRWRDQRRYMRRRQGRGDRCLRRGAIEGPRWPRRSYTVGGLRGRGGAWSACDLSLSDQGKDSLPQIIWNLTPEL